MRIFYNARLHGPHNTHADRIMRCRPANLMLAMCGSAYDVIERARVCLCLYRRIIITRSLLPRINIIRVLLPKKSARHARNRETVATQQSFARLKHHIAAAAAEPVACFAVYVWHNTTSGMLESGRICEAATCGRTDVHKVSHYGPASIFIRVQLFN